MLKASYCPYRLIFKSPATTSRETMTYKDTYFIKIWHDDCPESYGIGECALFHGLSADDKPDYESRLRQACRDIDVCRNSDYSSIQFGIETALADLANGARRLPYPSAWTSGEGSIPINGLVWMGTIDEMTERVEQKLLQGFRCIKFKIGGQDFEKELTLLNQLRQRFSESQLEIRLDANGAFSPDNALRKLDRLSKLRIHSIEQPIRAGQLAAMAEICRESPIPIALDEELIGVGVNKAELLEAIRPQYIILKPALCGGLSGAKEWIGLAQSKSIGWWVTSALESNIGLSVLAQWVATLDTHMPQGLGTGALYVNNIVSPLRQTGDSLRYDPQGVWEIPIMQWIDPE